MSDYTDQELGEFARKLGKCCPILTVTALQTVVEYNLIPRDELVKLYERGWGWCVNWENIAQGKNSLN